MKGPGPTARDRRRRRAKREREYKVVCAEVDARDGDHCRACGKYAGDFAHHHHLIFRSHGGLNSPSNLIKLCVKCHDLVHRRRLLVHGTSADSVEFEPVE